jgi:RNase adaptor protein for sRNA GlmZ degradation
MQPEHLQEHVKDPRAAALGQRGGQNRMAQLNAQERSAFSRYAANARWHPLETRLQRERAEEIARLVKQAIDDYLPNNKRNMIEP